MKLTNLQVLNSVQGLNALSQNKMGIKFAWKITTALKALELFAKAADESMQEIRNKYAKTDSLGNIMEALNDKGEKVPNTVQIPVDKIPLFNKEMNELMSQEVEVTNVQLKVTDFPENIELEPSVLLSVSALIVE